MKHGNFMIGMVIVALAVIVFTGCSKNGERGTPEPAKDPGLTEAQVPREIPEFTYGRAPGSLENYMAKVKNDTDTLVILLREKKATGDNLTEDDWKNSMGETYLKNPKLTWNDRTFEDIDEIISALNSIIAESQSFEFTKAHVAFQHIPFNQEEGSQYLLINKDRPFERRIDFIGHIKATIKYNGDFTMEGTLPHRHTCEPEL